MISPAQLRTLQAVCGLCLLVCMAGVLAGIIFHDPVVFVLALLVGTAHAAILTLSMWVGL